MISDVFINLKKWLQVYGHEVLDLFIYPDNQEYTEPMLRYNNFNEQFNAHVGTSEHFQMNQGVNFPFLAMDISCDKTSHCFTKYYVDFTVYYSSVSPTTGRVCIENTPEGKLEYRDKVYCAISNMLTHQVVTNKGLKRINFADDVASLDGWYLPIKLKVNDIGKISDFSNELVDEVEMFTFPVNLSMFTCG